MSKMKDFKNAALTDADFVAPLVSDKELIGMLNDNTSMKNVIECKSCGAKFNKDVGLQFGNYWGTSTTFASNGVKREPWSKTGKCIMCGEVINEKRYYVHIKKPLPG